MSQDSNNPQNRTIAGAITYPSSTEQNMQPTPVQPRQPRSLQGLLRFAMEATKAEDAPGNSEFGPMDDERRKFLEEALRSLTVNVVEVLQNAIKVLTDQEKIRSINPSDVLPEDVKTAFANLLDYIDDIDIANDFYKMGGFAIFPVCYGSENDEVRSNASWVLGELCQNNPYCQARVFECGILNVLLNLLNTEQDNALAKCIFAISCACREWEPSCRELVSQGACVTLADCLRARSPAARAKAAFFVRCLCSRHPPAREQFIEMNLVRIISQEIKKERDFSTEHLLGVLSILTKEDPRAIDQCRDPSLELKATLEELATNEEEKEACKELVKRIFDDCPQVEAMSDEIADR